MTDALAKRQSGMPGMTFNAKLNKWIVRLNRKGKQSYHGVYDDYEEARRVCAAARLDHEIGERTRADTAADLTEAELARFALDAEGDPIWRPKPLMGDEADIREAARWNSRHAGKKLEARVGFKRNGKIKRAWAKDLIPRLIASGWQQGGGLPRNGAAEVEIGAPPPGDVQPVGLGDGPLGPIGEGPLARVIHGAVRNFGGKLDDYTALSSGKDAYRLDTPIYHTFGRWFAEQLERLAPGRQIHLRGFHYLLVAAHATRPDGAPYENVADDYRWLNDRAGKAARWLGYIPFDRIVDERNDDPVLYRAPRLLGAPSASNGIENGYYAPALPEVIRITTAKPYASLSGFTPEQKFCFAVFGEKSSLAEILNPFARRHGADLFLATGELSETRAEEMARAAVEDGRKLVCITFSDIDPAGAQMPVSISRKFMAQRDLNFPEFKFAVVAAALSLEQVIALQLPPAMVEKNDKRRGTWQEAYSSPLIEAGLLMAESAPGDENKLAQVEIDALLALHPGELNRIAEAAIAPFLDATLGQRAQERAMAWRREAETALAAHVDAAPLERLTREQAEAGRRFNRRLRRLRKAKAVLDDVQARMHALIAAVTLPPIPNVPEAEPAGSVTPLVDSGWDFIRMTKALKARKAYDE